MISLIAEIDFNKKPGKIGTGWLRCLLPGIDPRSGESGLGLDAQRAAVEGNAVIRSGNDRLDVVSCKQCR